MRNTSFRLLSIQFSFGDFNKRVSNDRPETWKPEAYSAEDLAADLGISYRSLCAEAARIDNYGYTQFVTRKSGKARVISAPRKWLADLQATLATSVLARLPVAESVYSQRGCDPIKNAGQLSVL